MLCIPKADRRGSLEINAGSGMWVATPVTVCPPTIPELGEGGVPGRGHEGGRACRGHRGGEGCSRWTAGSGRIQSLLPQGS